jgi:hypothetical protein
MACGCNKNKSSSINYGAKQLNITTASYTSKTKTKEVIRAELLKRMREGTA